MQQFYKCGVDITQYTVISMKKLLGMDEAYEELKQMNLIGSIFEDMPFCLIRKYAKTLSLVSNITEVEQVIKKLREENKNSLQSLKTLIFLNFLLNQPSNSSKSKIDQIVSSQINKIICTERKRYQQIQKDRANPRGISVEKAVNGIKRMFSKSKQKIEVRMTRTFSHNTKIASHNQTATQMTQSNDTPRESEAPTQGKQQLLICEIIIPYASYLLKAVSSQIDFNRNTSKLNLKNQEIWKIINLLKSLLKMSEVFPKILRYYHKQYYYVVMAVIRIMDYEIKALYPTLEKSVMSKAQLIERETLQIYSKAQNQRRKVELLEGVVFKFELEQFKHILHETAAVNQLIINIYLGKYTYAGISSSGIKQPVLFDDQSKCQLVHDILKQVQKSKSAAKRLSDSKQKSKMINSPSNLSKPRLKTESQTGVFSQKKLMIVQKDKKKTPQKQKKTLKQEALKLQAQQKQQMVGSTFRKMRLNMTQNVHLQDSNTRRLRL